VKVVLVKFAAQLRVCTVLCETTKQAMNLSVHQDGGHPSTGFQKYWTLLKSQYHAITNKNPEAGSVVQQVHKVLNDIEILARCTQAKVGESSEWTPIVNSAEENRVNFCKGLDGKLLFSVLYCMYTLTLNEL
jgi:hypothetical protein